MRASTAFGAEKLRRQAAPLRSHGRPLTPSFDGGEYPPAGEYDAEGRGSVDPQPIKPTGVMLVDDTAACFGDSKSSSTPTGHA